MTLQSPGAYLQTLAERPFLRSLGLMTGTSMDGLDLALVTVSGDRDLHGDPEWYGFVPFPKRLRQEITQGLDGATSMVADLNYSLGWWMAEAAKKALKNAHLPDPDCIGSHGHSPSGGAGIFSASVSGAGGVEFSGDGYCNRWNRSAPDTQSG